MILDDKCLIFYELFILWARNLVEITATSMGLEDGSV
jgi:hypothetical protein